MLRRRQTKSSTPRLSEIAKHLVIPEGIVSTEWPAIEQTCAQFGIGFDLWQKQLGSLIVAKDANGKYAAGIGGVVASIPRQVGKTYLIGWVTFALAIKHPGLTVIWTAHRSRTADETFRAMQGMAKRSEVAGHIEKITTGAGDQTIHFANRARIMFGARESGFGRGFQQVDLLVFDEAQILTDRAIDDMVPAQNVSTNALTILIGTPPKPSDPSEVFEAARADALSGEVSDALYVEFAADPTCDPDDRTQWRKANPSYPLRTPDSAMLRMRRRLGVASFRREALGIWDEQVTKLAAFPKDAWEACLIADPDDSWPLAAIGLEMDRQRSWCSIGVSATGDVGQHLEVALDADCSEVTAEWIADWVAKRARRKLPVVMDSFSPARSLEPLLRARGCKVWVLSAAELAQACMGLHDAVRDGAVTHFGQEVLDAAVVAAGKEPVGKAGAWKFTRESDEAPLRHLFAVAAAHYGAVKSERRRVAAETHDKSKSRRVVVLA